MIKKHLVAAFGLMLGLLTVFAIPVLANFLTSASATVDCKGFTLTVDASHLSTGTMYTIDFTFTLTCNGINTPVMGTKMFTATGSTAMVTVTGTWPTSPLTIDCTVAGTAKLSTSGIVVPITITGTLTCAILTDERMTGGGSLDVGNPGMSVVVNGDPNSIDVTHGFEIHCGAPPDKPNNLEVNWPSHHFHMDVLTMGVCVCNLALLPPDNPDAGFNEFIGAGTGKLDNVEGASIVFDFTDQGEPGTNDTEHVTIFTPGPNPVPVLSFLTTKLTFGNQQAHRDGGPKVPPCTV